MNNDLDDIKEKIQALNPFNVLSYALKLNDEELIGVCLNHFSYNYEEVNFLFFKLIKFDDSFDLIKKSNSLKFILSKFPDIYFRVDLVIGWLAYNYKYPNRNEIISLVLNSNSLKNKFNTPKNIDLLFYLSHEKYSDSKSNHFLSMDYKLIKLLKNKFPNFNIKKHNKIFGVKL